MSQTTLSPNAIRNCNVLVSPADNFCDKHWGNIRTTSAPVLFQYIGLLPLFSASSYSLPTIDLLSFNPFFTVLLAVFHCSRLPRLFLWPSFNINDFLGIKRTVLSILTQFLISVVKYINYLKAFISNGIKYKKTFCFSLGIPRVFWLTTVVTNLVLKRATSRITHLEKFRRL